MSDRVMEALEYLVAGAESPRKAERAKGVISDYRKVLAERDRLREALRDLADPPRKRSTESPSEYVARVGLTIE